MAQDKSEYLGWTVLKAQEGQRTGSTRGMTEPGTVLNAQVKDALKGKG